MDAFELTILKFGNSLGAILPNEVVRRLRTKNGGKIFLVEEETDYRLIRHDPGFAAKLQKAEEILFRYRTTRPNLAN